MSLAKKKADWQKGTEVATGKVIKLKEAMRLTDPPGSRREAAGLVQHVADGEEHHGVGEEEGDAQTHFDETSEVNSALPVGQVQCDDVLGVCITKNK